jgi:hypothetical protein
LLVVASSARGLGYSEERACELAAEVAGRCRPPLTVRDPHEYVAWVYARLPRWRDESPGRAPEAGIIEVALARVRGRRRLNRTTRLPIFLDMCREMQGFLGDRPVALPQRRLALALRCTQPTVSGMIARAVADGTLEVAARRYRPGRRAKLYRVVG